MINSDMNRGPLSWFSNLARWVRLLLVLVFAVPSLGACELLQNDARFSAAPLEPKVSAPPKAAPAKPVPESSTVELNSGLESSNSVFPGGQKPPPLIVQGTGALSAATPETTPSLPPPTPQQDVAVTLNFVDADIRELIKSILGDTLSLTYTIDPRVVGTVTLKTNTPLKRDEILPALEGVLSLNGYALVKDGATYTILPAAEIKDIPLLADRQEAGFGLEIIRLHHVSPTAVAAALNQYAAGGAIRIIDDVRGLIAVAASGPERLKIRELISVFDVNQLSGMSFGIFPVSAAEPQELINELGVVFNPLQDPNQNGVLKFLPINRLSSILVIASRPADLAAAGEWIDRLDHKIVSDEPRLYVHHVQHGQAKTIAATLQAIFGGANTVVAPAPPPSGNVAPNQSPVSLDSSGMASPTGPLGADASGFGPEGTGMPDIQPDSATAGAMPAAATTAADATVSPETAPGKKIRIIADQTNNSLYILATPQDFRDIRAALDSLDTEPLQVLIEATIAEVTLNDKLKYGVEWFFRQGNNSETLAQNLAGIPTAVFPGFNYVYAASNIRAVVSALDEITHVNVISSPQLMVLDNRTALLQVGDEVPIITQSAVSVIDPAAPIVNSVQFRSTGVILSVTPRVNSSGNVELDIQQEVSDVVPTTTSTIDSPTIQQRKVRSSVSVHNGQTIALGGLIRDRQSHGKSGIPLLSDIPVIGSLFGTTTVTADRTELLVLITPHVIRSPAEADAVTDELRQRLQSVLPLARKIQ
jgi:general secretion pathway protein D